MATINVLREALRQKARELSSSPKKPLSDSKYDRGFEILTQHLGRTKYENFITPQLSLLLKPLFNARSGISILEIGPGQESVLGGLPNDMRRKVRKYTAYEPNEIFASRLQEWLCKTIEQETALPCLAHQPDSHRVPFDLDISSISFTETGTGAYDVVLFCHSMYGMEPKRSFIERALSMLSNEPDDGMVVVFHRAGCLNFDGLVYHRTAYFPDGRICGDDADEVVDNFTRFIAGFVLEDLDDNQAIGVAWRKICRNLAHRSQSLPNQLIFSSPDMMVAFSHSALALPELTSQVPMATEDVHAKNREARCYFPAAVMKPGEVGHVQRCARWAVRHGAGLTIIGGVHSGQCVWSNTVAVDMSNFEKVEIFTSHDAETVIVVGAGCTSGDIIRKTMAAGFTVPLGSRPSVGAGLCLQGGIGHLARQHGLACDAIIGAMVVSVASGDILCVGDVPSQCRRGVPMQAQTNPDLLWALKGAGTNFGIVMSIAFKVYPAPMYTIRNWMTPINDKSEARLRLCDFDKLMASMLPRD